MTTQKKLLVWYGFEAKSLENDRMRVIIVPQLGSKIVSIYDKKCSREWLASPVREVKATQLGDSFADQDMSGWDEMFPTILPCEWEGSHFPDHGEVWSVPWRIHVDEDRILTSVNGTGFTYRLSRTASFSQENCLRLDYALHNDDEKRFPWIWAAHPQFLATGQTQIVLPADVHEVINVVDDDPVFGALEGRFKWPTAVLQSGETLQLNRVGSPTNHACRKFYLDPDQSIHSAALHDHEKRCQLKMRWQADFPMVLGIWVDEGYYNTASVVALEPSSGYYDGLPAAVRNKRITWIEPGETIHWSLEIELVDHSQ